MSISSSVAGQGQQTHRIATGVFNAEHTINEVNARLEALTRQITSQSQIETTTRTTLSFRLMPLSITLEQTSSREQRTSHVIKPKRTVRIGSVRLPKWFLQRQYDLQLLYATSGFPFSLNACSIVPYGSPFFEACMTGNIETIKVLLSNQQASIYDRDPCGYTAFQYAIVNRQLEVCRLLRHAGIFTQFDLTDYERSLACLEQSVNDFTEHNLSLLRVITPLVGLLSLLNVLQIDTAMLNVSHLRSYVECRIRSRNSTSYESFMPYIARVLSNISTVREITAARDEYAWVVYALASEIAHGVLEEDHQLNTNERLHSVRQALCAVVRAGLNPHQTSGNLECYQDLGMTPLGLLCVESLEGNLMIVFRNGTLWQSNEPANKKLQAWLTGLHSAGIDLLQYAKSEYACYPHGPDSLAIPWKADAIIMVVTGPRPEDWRLSLWEPCESYARLFWCWTEEEPVVPRLTAKILETFLLPTSQNPTSPDLPGSWPSEEARIVEKLESWLLEETDDILTQIEEDLSLLSEADFFAGWDEIYDILRLRQ
jgi:hypothetical protein